jgi:hypothetical protein
MQVYDIKVRFMRKIQVRDYEPTESEVTCSAQLEDGEDPKAAIKAAFKILSEEVHTSLGLAPNTKLPTRGKATGEHVQAEASVTDKTPAPTPAPASDKKPAEKKAADKTTKASATDDIPGEGAPATKTTAASAASSDIPGEETAPQTQQTAAAETATDMTPADLSKWIGEQVRSGKVTSQAITALYPKFGISRFADLKPEKCGEAKAAVEELIKKGS